MRADGVLAMLDRWGRLLLPGTILLFFVLMTGLTYAVKRKVWADVH